MPEYNPASKLLSYVTGIVLGLIWSSGVIAFVLFEVNLLGNAFRMFPNWPMMIFAACETTLLLVAIPSFAHSHLPRAGLVGKVFVITSLSMGVVMLCFLVAMAIIFPRPFLPYSY